MTQIICGGSWIRRSPSAAIGIQVENHDHMERITFTHLRIPLAVITLLLACYPLAVAANTTYVFEASLAYTAGTTGDFKAAMSFPSGATCFVSVFRTDGTTYAEAAGGQINSGTSISGGGLGATIPVLQFWRGVLMVGATAGNLQVQFAQNVSNGTATTMKAGSVLKLL